MRLLTPALLILAAPGLTACATTASAQSYPEAAAYDPAADAAKQLDEALARARTDGKKVLLVMGANWCHDSRALAGWLATPRFQQLVADKYELLFVDVGTPQTGQGRNLELASRFGIEVKSTPTVLVLSGSGELLNRDAATRWGNASSRSADEIYDELVAG